MAPIHYNCSSLTTTILYVDHSLLCADWITSIGIWFLILKKMQQENPLVGKNTSPNYYSSPKATTTCYISSKIRFNCIILFTTK
eukprot:UN00769